MHISKAARLDGTNLCRACLFRPVHISKAARLLVEINGAIESVPASAHIQGR